VTLKRGYNLKYLPVVFTEHGALMAATVLNSPTAVQMSIFVVRAFLRLRSWAMNHAGLTRRLAKLERRVGVHEQDLRQILAGLRHTRCIISDSSPRDCQRNWCASKFDDEHAASINFT